MLAIKTDTAGSASTTSLSSRAMPSMSRKRAQRDSEHGEDELLFREHCLRVKRAKPAFVPIDDEPEVEDGDFAPPFPRPKRAARANGKRAKAALVPIGHEPEVEDGDFAPPFPRPKRAARANGKQAKAKTKAERDDGDEDEISMAKKAAKAAADDDDMSKKKAKKDTSSEEKRLRRVRDKPPQSYLEVHGRATTQRMYVIDRTRCGTEEAPEESVQLVGTTGNIYTVHIGQVPSCDCPHAKKGNQCKHVVYFMVRILRAPERLQYQLALLKSELREIFAAAPPILSPENAGKENSRKAVEGECAICCLKLEPDKEPIVWCKAACGNNVHAECFGQWAATKKGGGGVTCPFCRTPWIGDDDTLKHVAKSGELNEEGYVNVAAQLGLSGQRDTSTYYRTRFA